MWVVGGLTTEKTSFSNANTLRTTSRRYAEKAQFFFRFFAAAAAIVVTLHLLFPCATLLNFKYLSHRKFYEFINSTRILIKI
jgi:hypothetical protein